MYNVNTSSGAALCQPLLPWQVPFPSPGVVFQGDGVVQVGPPCAARCDPGHWELLQARAPSPGDRDVGLCFGILNLGMWLLVSQRPRSHTAPGCEASAPW